MGSSPSAALGSTTSFTVGGAFSPVRSSALSSLRLCRASSPRLARWASPLTHPSTVDSKYLALASSSVHVVDPSGASEYVVSLQLIADGGALAFSRIVLVDARRSASDSEDLPAAAANGLAPATRSPLGATSNAHRSP